MSHCSRSWPTSAGRRSKARGCSRASNRAARIADTLREVASTLTSVLALDQITTLILEQLQRVVPYDTAALLLRDGDRLSITATRGFTETVRAQIERCELLAG